MTDPLHDDLHDNPTQTGDETGAGRPAEELTSSLLAYGDEPETEPETEPGQTMPKRRVVAWAAGILAAGCAIAGGIVVWDATHHPTARSHPAATTTAAAAPTTAVAPPPTVTVQAPTPQTTVAPTPGPSAYDQNFLSLMRQEGWGRTDNSDAEQCGKEMISFAHQVCSYAGLDISVVYQNMAGSSFISPAREERRAVANASQAYPNCTFTEESPPPAAPPPAAPTPTPGLCYYSPEHPECPPRGLTSEQRNNY